MANENLEYKIVVKDLATGALKNIAISANQADKALDKASNSGKKMSMSMASFVGNVGASAFMSVLSFAKQAGQAMWDIGTQSDFARASFTAMLDGNASKADEHIANLREMAKTTPLETTQLVDASKTLMQFGVDVKTTIPLMRALGDVAGGNAERFKSMALVMGQVTGAGRLQGQDLLQFINAGWNPLNEIVKKTGETMAQVKDRMSKGGVSAYEVSDALASATAEGGKFFGLMDAQSKTVGGKWSNFVDSIQLKMISLWNSNNSILGGIIDKASYVVEWFQTNWNEIVKVFEPLKLVFQDFYISLNSVTSGFGEIGGAGNVLKTIFTQIGRVIQLVTPILRVMFSVAGALVGILIKVVNGIIAVVDGIMKLFKISGKEFKFKTPVIEQAKKTEALKDVLAKGGGQEFLGAKGFKSGAISGTGNTTKTARTSDIKNITINIGKMVEDLTVQVLQGNQVSAIEREVKKVIALAVNDFNAIGATN